MKPNIIIWNTKNFQFVENKRTKIEFVLGSAAMNNFATYRFAVYFNSMLYRISVITYLSNSNSAHHDLFRHSRPEN